MSDSLPLRADGGATVDARALTLRADGGGAAAVDARAGSVAAAPSSASGGAAPTLARHLKTLDLTAIGIGGIVGAGIFVLSGQAAARYAGPAVTLSFALAGVACLFCGLAYSELSSMFPVAGSAYAYATAGLGGVAGWLIGWDLVLEYSVGAATVSVGLSGYLCSILKDFGAPCPPAFASAPFSRNAVTGAWVPTGAAFNAPAVAVALLLAALAVRGVRESAAVTNALVALKIGVLLIFLLASVGHVDSRRWSPFFIPADAAGNFGAKGVIAGSSVVFFSFVGFDAISTASGEAVDPQRAVPVATLASLGVCTALYICVALAMTGLVDYRALDVADPLAVALDAAGPGLAWVRPIVKLGAVCGLASVILVLVNGQARITFAMASDGLLPAALARVHPVHKTPAAALALAGATAGVLAALVPIDALGEMVSIGTLAAFAFVCATVLVLRRTRPAHPRPFRVPCSPAVPALGIAMCAMQMVVLPPETWARLAAWTAVGGAVYWGYARHHALPIEARVARLFQARAGDEVPAAPATPAPLLPRDDDGW
jgi:APA family basic amino acid/polyamine antiporter